MFDKERILFIILGGFFICNAVLAEIIGVKLFSVEEALGFEVANFSLLGEEGLSFTMTAGVLLWPAVFIMTDIINEYFGMRGVRVLSWLAAVLIAYAFIMVALARWLPPAGFWEFTTLEDGSAFSREMAFDTIFRQGMWIIVGSLVAFLIGQFLDVIVFHRLKKVTGERYLWLRATGSTLISQFIDSFVVLFIAFYIGGDLSLPRVIALGLVGYSYKFAVAILLTPILYLLHAVIDKWLGKELSQKMLAAAANSEDM